MKEASFQLQVDSCEDTRENTPDSDSGYVGSVVTVTATSRTFSRPFEAAMTTAGQPPQQPQQPPKSFLSEIQNVQRRKAENSPTSPSNSAVTLADQLRTRLEERRKSKEEDQPQQQQSAFVPESIAADIQKAVKMANDTSKYQIISRPKMGLKCSFGCKTNN